MFKDKEIRFILPLLALLLLCTNTQEAFAQLKKEPAKDNIVTSLSHKTIELVQTDQMIELLTKKNGNTVSLPRVEQVVVEQPSSISKDLFVALDKAVFNKIIFHEDLIERKEMQELTRELGIKVQDKKYLNLYREVVEWIGTPYRYGSMSSKGVDCSGFTSLVFKAVYGQVLPRASAAMARTFQETVEKEHLEPGDLVFFATRGRKNINHVGIYVGDKHFIHASTSQGVIVSSLSDPYYAKAWKRGARIEQE